MSKLNTVEPFGEGFISALCPELILFAGLILLIVVPNLEMVSLESQELRREYLGCLAVIGSN